MGDAMKFSAVLHVVPRVHDVLLSLCHSYQQLPCQSFRSIESKWSAQELGVWARAQAKVVEAYAVMATRYFVELRNIAGWLRSLDYSAVAERLIPSLAIRDRSVFGLMPSWTAAPCSPAMTQPDFFLHRPIK